MAGALTVGRASFQGSQGDYFTGAVDDVQAFQGALTDVDVTIVHSGITVEPPQVIGDSVVEDQSYPNAAAILAAHGMRLISGDGHLTLTECVTPSTGLVRLYFRPDYAQYPTATSSLCFKVTGGTAHLTMDIPGTYSIRGGSTPVEAKLITDGQPQTVQVAADTWTPVGEGTGSGHYSVLRELRIGQVMAPVTGAQAAVGKLDTGGRSCTGTLINQQWVLTAASCFADRAYLAQGAPPRTSQIVFPGHAPVAINHLVPRPDRDLVLGRLATAITDVTPIRVTAAAPAADAALNTVGFGRTATDWVTDQQRSATVTLSEVTATTLTGSTAAGRLCKGDAGGAVTNAAGEIVGVNSKSGQGGCLGSSATGALASHARVDNIGQWVDQQAISDVLLRGQTLEPGQRLRSNNGVYELNMQTDGNLVLYQTGGPAIWDAGTGGNPGSRLIVNSEGNPLILRPDGQLLWHSVTHGTPADRLMLQSDGNLLLKGPDGNIYWRPPVLLRGHTLEPGQRLRSNNAAYELNMQWDGNLVLYQTGGPAIWSSGTDGNPGSRLIMQGDGNLVVYRPDGQPLWNSSTAGTPADHLMLQSDGNLVLYGLDGTPYWQR